MKVAIKNARCLLQRTRDAKIIRGWVFDYGSDRLVTLAQTSSEVLATDQFVVTIVGYPEQCSTTARVVAVNPLPRALSTEIATSTQIVLQTLTPFTIQKSVEQPRFRAEGMHVNHRAPDERDQFSADIADIGPAGFSVSSRREFERGQIFEVSIDTGVNEIVASVQVRSHRELAGGQGRTRTGFEILAMSRDDAQRWTSVFQAVVAANTVEIGHPASAALRSA